MNFVNMLKSLFIYVNSYMFFTKWGLYASMVERAQLSGLDRKPLVDHKIVYPYGLAVDIPSEHVYWVDTYLDFVERINYDGSNRRTIQKGFPVISQIYMLNFKYTN